MTPRQKKLYADQAKGQALDHKDLNPEPPFKLWPYVFVYVASVALFALVVTSKVLLP